MFFFFQIGNNLYFLLTHIFILDWVLPFNLLEMSHMKAVVGKIKGNRNIWYYIPVLSKKDCRKHQ